MALVTYRHVAMPSAMQSHTILTASVPYYSSHVMSSHSPPNHHHENTQADKPIGYGAFGVVWSVTDPRDGKRVALKKMTNVFQNLVACKRVYRELKMLCHFKHENVLCALDVLQPPHIDYFNEIHVICELMQSDLHKIIVSPQTLTADHVKVFMYQILRGVKYLHSARVLHRDIKPGNLLVNSNCVVKICDFGLARVDVPDNSTHLTQEVVTQYYRAPEILMGAKHYTTAVDMWSVGCIFAELLSRKILFQAAGPLQQLDLIVDLLGTPTLGDMRTSCAAARKYVLQKPARGSALHTLYSLSSQVSQEAFHLLSALLCWNADARLSASDALNHPYLEEGRLRYHSCMCKCCYTTNAGRIFAKELEPVCSQPFSYRFEDDLTSIHRVREKLHKFIVHFQSQTNKVPLCINPNSAAYKVFATSGAASESELPPSPHVWE